MAPAQRICAWCGHDLGGASLRGEPARVTHGLCRDCLDERLHALSPLPFQPLLPGLGAPPAPTRLPA